MALYKSIYLLTYLLFCYINSIFNNNVGKWTRIAEAATSSFSRDRSRTVLNNNALKSDLVSSPMHSIIISFCNVGLRQRTTTDYKITMEHYVGRKYWFLVYPLTFSWNKFLPPFLPPFFSPFLYPLSLTLPYPCPFLLSWAEILISRPGVIFVSFLQLRRVISIIIISVFIELWKLTPNWPYNAASVYWRWRTRDAVCTVLYYIARVR